MKISNVTKSYVLNNIILTPDNLLLDPHNPRIALDIEEKVNYSDQELISTSVQNYILSIINKSEHHIAELIRGIREAGFMPGTAPIIVKKIKNTSKYKVIEGNRRLTAIKYLLNDKDDLDHSVLKSLEKIEVKEFCYKENRSISEEEAIDILLGSIHLKGLLQWGPIEKSLYVFRSYMRELIKEFEYKTDFYYVDSISKKIAKYFNYKPKDVQNLLKIYRVYEQLKDYDYPVKPFHYSLIELAVKNQALRKNYFELHKNRYQFSGMGLERFAALCIGNDRPIHNPVLFNKFAKIFKNGTEYDVVLVESKDETVTDVFETVQNRIRKGNFYSQLNKVKKLLDGLVVAEYQNTEEELFIAKEINQLVKDKLSPLARN